MYYFTIKKTVMLKKMLGIKNHRLFYCIKLEQTTGQVRQNVRADGIRDAHNGKSGIEWFL